MIREPEAGEEGSAVEAAEEAEETAGAGARAEADVGADFSLPPPIAATIRYQRIEIEREREIRKSCHIAINYDFFFCEYMK